MIRGTNSGRSPVLEVYRKNTGRGEERKAVAKVLERFGGTDGKHTGEEL
jgi:hypothetical protein